MRGFTVVYFYLVDKISQKQQIQILIQIKVKLDWRTITILATSYWCEISCSGYCKSKIGIKCFGRFLLVVHGRKTSKSHFHVPFRRRKSDEDRRNV